jgi:hypothetical protein
VTDAHIDADPDTGRDVAPTAPGRRRRVDKGLLALSLLIAVGLVLVVRGVAVSITGDDRANLPETIESVEPVPEAVQVLNQTHVFVDLVAGYTGVLVIDGFELETVNIDDVVSADAEPGTQVDLPDTTVYEPGNATLSFAPNDNAPVTGFETGVHQAQVIYWKVEEGRQRARSYSWTFNVV